MTIQPIVLPETIVIGVLALQGAFVEHIHYLQKLRPQGHTIKAIPIRTLSELEQCQALVIPGGESTVISSIASHTPGLLEALIEFARDPAKAVWGTCAGMILMADVDGIGGGRKKMVKGWEGIGGMKVWRNLYGTQLESFEASLTIPSFSNPSKPFNAIFIRAPAVHSLSPESQVEVVAQLPEQFLPPPPPSDSPLGEPNLEDLGKVWLKKGKKMVTSFHPELSGDVRVHEFWVEKCVLGR
ncbi:pyridoxal 5'-phosphate synthase, glutaminase subunit Pdx2 [Kwoniella mangroviensis CBS 8886]|uniref:pyridoxal 5'-phosphate synthase, glutaminase subunit Pdx2 n=1 Tax=Kwoniella mangroviensis CBS 8507 TaxID=1296122 RepID=UPI00080CF06E|nr:pyridoxal 5'-phosphate synthase, glutaminase subunit Pdx2 [Kwoniella mangroviensis CBS 8507]OCF66314.1 pyridoxal 5'-phosphate synthase, glutaminase subunit Pdx2 [Kwoniella mangroviensis CBS 8507]OCF73451.1 pyridoxal 5'-phosphate synthase, glutaminase subunit Pdx2 [Kwoniella mangroviensis CBS 8886]